MLSKEVLLAHFPKITWRRFHDLLAAFSSLDNAWNAEFEDIRRIGWDDSLTHEFILWKKNIQEEEISATLAREGISCITKDDAAYPRLLREIYDPPFCLFVRGTLAQDQFPIAVVGTRKNSPYGRQIADELTADLARRGITIISGLALGIDGIAHEAAVAAGGRTIGILGGGVDEQFLYPRAHVNLARKIMSHGGAIISEYPPGFLPTVFSFPRRNRIIAGMSLGTLVIEAPETSGALITAQCSLDMNREVFAVPQNITSPTAAGPNNLIKMGAKPVTNADDILDALNLRNIREYVTNTAILPDSPTEATILPHLSKEPLHIDQIIKRSGLAGSAVTSAITMMEMKGKIKNMGGMLYILAR